MGGGGPGRASLPAAAAAAATAVGASSGTDGSDVGSAQFSWRRGEWNSSRRGGGDTDSVSATREAVGGLLGTSADVAAQTAEEKGQNVAEAVVGGEEGAVEGGERFRVGADLVADFKRR